MVAQELALEHPERIRTLALGCTYCGGEQAALAGPEVLAMFRQAWGAGAAGPRRHRPRRHRPRRHRLRRHPAPAARHRTARACSAPSRRTCPPGPSRAWRSPCPAPLGAILLQLQAVGGHDTSARLPGLRVPTLVLHGTRDPVLPAANGELIARLVPDARLELLGRARATCSGSSRPGRTVELLREHARGSQATAA
jgi:pimeloyl-ACP methyl ester carboxylesterase